jgi:septum site-determining protein MinD
MVKVYTIASGKGGTGKTTVSVNLGTMLAQLGKETYLMDADIGMANVGLVLGLQDAPVTLHEVLAGKGNINDAIYEGPAGLKVIPSGISLQGFQQADPDRIRDVMGELVKRCEFLLIDAPAGISKDGVVPLAVADEVILIVNPELSSIVDALKTKILTEVVGGHVLGSIINRVDQDKTDIITKKMEKVLGVKVIGIIRRTPMSAGHPLPRPRSSSSFQHPPHPRLSGGLLPILSGLPIRKRRRLRSRKVSSTASARHFSGRKLNNNFNLFLVFRVHTALLTAETHDQ